MQSEDIDKLSFIHVTGTKGKGSTCVYTEGILRNYGYKTGFFNSPHLLAVRDRIMLNGKPLDEAQFTAAFWHVYDRLQLTRAKHDMMMPGFFVFMLVMALHIFAQEDVDVVLLEVGIGGQYDATNFVSRPLVCGITSMHVEHTDILGNTIEEIAWHKAGIMKSDVPLVTMAHQESVMAVLLDRAKEKECQVYMAQALSEEELRGSQLGIAGDVQATNASLAVQICRLWRHSKGKALTSCDVNGIDHQSDVMNVKNIPRKIITDLTPEEKKGLVSARLPGRNQIIKRHGITYYLDGAHTTGSMQQCVTWFNESAQKEAAQLGCKGFRSLVFRTKQDKPVGKIIPYLMKCAFRRLAFVPNVLTLSDRQKFPDSLDLDEDPEQARQISLSQLEVWKKLQEEGEEDHRHHHQVQPNPDVLSQDHCFPSIVSGLWWAGLNKDKTMQKMATEDLALDEDLKSMEPGVLVGPHNETLSGDKVHAQVLVTGSMALVGGVLSILQPDFWL
ncbi:hypothetical protein ACOMHN_067000 [Nucella lapillus]